MADGGWIKLYRSVRANWLWENGNERYAKWWMDILMMVNHEPRKVLVNGKLITIGIGERLTSISKLAAGWGASRGTVDRFLGLLVEDEMISLTKSKTNGTRVKVLHYADYQSFDGESRKRSEQRTVQGSVQRPVQRSVHKQEPKEPKNDKNIPPLPPESPAARKDVLEFWEQNGFGQLSPKTMADLDYWVKDLQDIGATEANANALLIKAMGVAVDSNVRRYAYVNSVLRRWEQQKYKSPEEVDADERQRTAKRNGADRGQAGRYPDGRKSKGSGESYGGIEF
ncbi:DnaD domain protein [Lacticaseibacillus sp. GG6-2]